ncbi:MAG: RagB/SusD family nutrient uptake outer membrane protein [Bacteroidales bacterium]|nr:RagB/SusD family nutrient uptake outer membrane protein [Bacteroidales bacterium]
MKKILSSTLLLAALAFTSCDMDEKPYGVLDDTDALITANDCYMFRNGFYNNIRSLTSGAYVYLTDLQADQFNGLISNGNTNGQIANANFSSSTTEFATVFAGLYSAIADVNYFLVEAQRIHDEEGTSDDDKAAIERYIAEGHFFRAYYYWFLMDRYCQAYSSDKGNQAALGLQLVTEFDPTGDTSKYPGRSTMNETLDLIQSDLTAAYNGLVEFEQTNKANLAPDAPYVSSMVVEALRARIALNTGDYTNALAYAKVVMESGYYSLTELDDYYEMWTTDSGSELIFVPFCDSEEQSSLSSTANGFISYQDDQTAYYIPAETWLYAYDDDDIRFDSFFNVWYLVVEGGNYPAYVFYKYPGNPDLVSTTDYRKNKGKPFRLSEQYLIAAEAAASLGQTDLAGDYINAIRRARIYDYEDETFSANTIQSVVREERSKELIGEGFRLSDLRRWNLGFTRDGAYDINPDVETIMVKAGLTVSYTAGDYRYTWPIPSSEMDITPALAGQQNPGY